MWSFAGAVIALIGGLLISLRGSNRPPQPRTSAVTGAPRRSGIERNSAPDAPLTPGTPAPGDRRGGAPDRTGPAESGAQPRPSPTQARDQLLARMRRSGRGAEPWMAQAGGVVTAWRELAPELARRISAGPIECYRDGCAIELAYPDRAAYEDVNASLPATRAFLDFPGWRHRTGVVTRPDGGVTATWFFMRPDGPVAEKE